MALSYDYLKGLQGGSYADNRKANTNQGGGLSYDYLKGVQQNRTRNSSQNIAPIKTITTTRKRKKKDEDGFFKSGEFFSDGSWDKGDLWNTVKATAVDLGEDVSAGIMGFGETAWDSLLMLGNAMANQQMDQDAQNLMMYNAVTGQETDGILEQNERDKQQIKKETEEYVKKDLYNEQEIARKIIVDPFERKTGIIVEDASVIDVKGDSLVYSAGNSMVSKIIGTIPGLQGLGYAGTFLSAMGGESEEALKQGATYEEALLSGVITGSAELGSSAAFNGVKIGGKTLTDKAVQGTVRNLSGKTLQTLAKWGINTVGEGTEEVVSDLMSAVGQKLTYLDEKEFNEIYSSEDAWDSFIGGVLMGGTFEGLDIASNKITGTDYVTGLNKNEQKVVDKEIENRIAEIEQDGNTLTKKDKNKIREDVLRDLDKGYISIDTIESVLGGETYDNYKATVEREDSLLKEFEELGERTNATLKEQARYKELEGLYNELKNSSQRSQLKSQLSDEVYNLAKNSRLAESYNERARLSEDFQADFSKFKGVKHEDAAKKTLENAMKVGANNTNRIRDLVEMNARVSGDLGIVFEYKSNEQIKNDFIERQTNEINKIESIPEAQRTEEQNNLLTELKDTLEKVKSGKVTVNGDITADSIVINLDSAKALNRLAGHEITHSLEKAKNYNELRDHLFAYARAKGVDIDSELAILKSKYQGIANANPEAELVADLVGDYLFTDADFINSLSTEKPNVFKRIYNEIKYLCKIATAGSKEARELEKVKRAFDKAYKQSGTKNTDTKYSLSDSDGKQLTKEQQDYFKDSKVRDENGNLKVMYHGTSKGGYTVFDTYGSNYGLFGQGSYFTDNKSVAEYYTNKGKGNNKQVYESYLNITNPLDMDAQGNINEWQKAFPEADFSNCNTNEEFYRAMEEYFEDEQYSKYEASEIAMDGIQSMGYDGITHIGGGRVSADDTRHQVYIAFEPEQIKNIDNIAPTKDADIRYSISEDSEGNKLTEKQSEYFKDSKAVDRNGNLLKVYHTTKNDFTVFDKSKKGEATEDANTYLGFFFTDDAEYMQNFPEFENGKTESYYLNMKNPIDMTDISEDAFLDIVEVMGGDVYEAEDVYREEFEEEQKRAKVRGDNNVSLQLGHLLDELTGEFYYDDFIRELQPHYDELMSKGYDGVINYMDELFGVKEYVVLDSHQAKLTSNTNPTEDADVRYSLSEDSEGRELSKEQQDYFKNAKTVDEEGRLKPFYHGTGRADRVGNVFDPNRATSGPMAYFTDSKEIADHYARDKKDTSIAYDSEYDSYETQFRVERNGKNMSVVDLWYKLPLNERNAIQEKAKHITMDDNWENVVYSEETQYGLGNFDKYELNRHKGNVLHTLVDSWLTDGNIYGEEQKFLDVLKLVGIEDAKYMNPEFRDEKTYQVYLNITNPFDTSDISEEMLEALRTASEEAEYVEGNSADLWDKRNVTPAQWIEGLEDDIANGTYHTWTRIPDFVTDTLKAHGYDGIFDIGGKGGGIGHTVAIPFYSEQIKNVDNLNPTTSKDIRYSLSDNLENFGKILYDNNNPLSIVNRAKSNNNSSINWVYKAEIFSVAENKQFHEKISEINQGSEAFAQNSRGEYMIPIENKIIFTDGNYNSPYIREIVEVLTEYQTEFEEIRSRIFNVEEGKSSKQEEMQIIEQVLGNGNIISYTSRNNGVYDWQNGKRKGKTRRAVVRNHLNKQYRRGNDKQSTETQINNENLSLSFEDEIAPTLHGNFDVYGKDFKVQEDIAPTVSKMEQVAPVGVAENTTTTPEEFAPMTEEEFNELNDDSDRLNSLTDNDVPPLKEAPYSEPIELAEKAIKRISKPLRDLLFLDRNGKKTIEGFIQKYSNSEYQSREDLLEEIRKNFGIKYFKERNDDITTVKAYLRDIAITPSQTNKGDIADYNDWRKHTFKKLRITNNGLNVDEAYQYLSEVFPGFFPDDIWNETDQLLKMEEVANANIYATGEYELLDEDLQKATDIIIEEVDKYKADLISTEETALRRESESESRRWLNEIAPTKATQITETAPVGETRLIKTVKERLSDKLSGIERELADEKQLQRESISEFNYQISQLQEEYAGKKDKNTKAANNILRRIEKLQRIRDSVNADYSKRISDLEKRFEKMNSKDFATVEQRKTKQQELRTQMEELVGDTSTWTDKKLGISYKVNTLKRNLRDIVRDANGKRDIAKADAIYEELQGKYNHNEAELNRESNRIKQQFAEMKITDAENTYIQMLGEYRHNPETTLTEDVVKEFYEKHKNSIDEAKVDKAIKMARDLYDDLLVKVNQVLSEQGMKEIPYRKGYFPHFTEDKQGILAKLLNWKTQNQDIPTDIAGLTENFKPNRSWQSFNKQRKSDITDYNFLKGLDTYVQGSLDWYYHIEDIQKRRAFENHIRYVHSEQGIKDKIEAIRNNDEYDAEEMQEQIDLVYREASNPLNNFVTDFRTATNTLAGKKSSLDRGMEEMTNRQFYSTMTNLSNRVSANMVGGSISSALTNFVPITQSWGQVSPISTLRAMKDTIVSSFRDDGTIDKSDFLTNRLRKADNLYKTNWDKVGDGINILMDSIDSFTSQTVWRSKYLENISKGMSENAAIKDADQFAENVMAGRSRGNNPTIFDSKNPLTKIFTVFQLEVNNQYGYMFKDMPQDMANESKAKLVKGYVTMFVGAYVYNALYSSIAGRDVAFDPIGIIEEFLRDLGFGDDEEEEEIAPVDAMMNLTDNILEDVPFIGGLLGGGRIPISSALPYGGIYEAYQGTLTDLSEGNTKNLTQEWLNPIYYLAMPMGGGQIKKSVQGLKMFDDDLPIAGSYTDSGNLRFPVEDTLGNRVQAGIFGQWANENARDYFDNERAPLKEKQIQEFIDVDIPIKDYWQYREDLKDLDTLEDKFDFIADMDLPVEKKNILINNIVDRKESGDLENYNDFANYEEFDFYVKNTDKYNFLEENGVSYSEYKSSEEAKENYDSIYSWWKNNPEKVTVSKAVTDSVIEYRGYTSQLYDIRADKDENGDSIRGSAKEKKIEYIWNLDIDDGAKYILFKSEYTADDTYNYEIIEYLNNRDDISYDEMVTILKELDFEVDSQGNIFW